MTATTPVPRVDVRWLVLLTVGFGTFMSTIDSTVVNAIVPELSRSLDRDLGAVDWVLTAYLLAASSLLLAAGRVGDIRGHKRVYLTGFAIFAIASGLCAFAPNLEALIGFRVLQGIGASMLYATGPAILVLAFPASQRGQALGLLAISTYAGLALGPSLGGLIADSVGWRAVFLVNVPLGAVAIMLGVRVVPAAERLSDETLDLPGTFIFMAGLAALVFGFHEVPSAGWLSTRALLPLGASAVLLALFVAVEARVSSPILPPSLFRRRLFSAAAGSAILNYIGVNGVIFIVPFYFVTHRDLSLTEASLILTAMPFMMMCTAPFSGRASDRIGSRVLATTGMVGLAGGILLLGQVAPHSTIAAVIPLAIIGVSAGMFAPPNNSALMGAVAREQQGVAGSVVATARNIGLGMGVALASSFFRQRIGHGADDAFRYVTYLIAPMMLVGAITSSLRGDLADETGPEVRLAE